MTDTLLMAGKTVLVTGATGGIGKATAVGLARLGARVGITGRDITRAEAAAADIRAASDNAAVDAFAADLSSHTEVRRLAREVLDRYPRLDVLVNSGGGQATSKAPLSHAGGDDEALGSGSSTANFRAPR